MGLEPHKATPCSTKSASMSNSQEAAGPKDARVRGHQREGPSALARSHGAFARPAVKPPASAVDRSIWWVPGFCPTRSNFRFAEFPSGVAYPPKAVHPSPHQRGTWLTGESCEAIFLSKGPLSGFLLVDNRLHQPLESPITGLITRVQSDLPKSFLLSDFWIE